MIDAQRRSLTDLLEGLSDDQWRQPRTIHHVACRRAAALPTDRIMAEIRGMIGARRHTVGVTHLATLTDILVHGQDIAVPLGHRHDMPPAVAASRALSMRWPRPFRRPARSPASG